MLIIKEKAKNFLKGHLYDALLGRDVPFFIEDICELVKQNTKIEGIFRKSGSQSNIDSICSKIDTITLQEREKFKAFLASQPTHDIIGAMKQYLRTLKETIIPSYYFNVMKLALSIENMTHQVFFIRRLIDSLPTANYQTLKVLTECMKAVVANTDVNLMTPCTLR